MTQEAALYNFFNSFGIPAYPNTAVPKDPVLPYITYPPVSGYWENIANATVHLWMRTTSEAEINRKAREIADRIGDLETLICDGGVIALTMGNPWVVPASAQDENTLKLRQINVTIAFFTDTRR